MTNTTRMVQRLLDHDVAIKRDLSRGVINKRALAQYIQKHLHTDESIDAVMSAIRRYEFDISEEKRFVNAGELIKNGKISTKTGIAIVVLVKEPSVQELLPKLFTAIQHTRGKILRIIQAEESIKIIVDEENISKVTNLFKKNDVLNIEHNLGEINMELAPTSAKVPGILAILFTELANNNINVVEAISCVPELLWFVNQKDLLKAHQTFLELIEGFKRERKS
ncbi:MAG: hypothetical protein ABIH72_04330 [archaeon]